MVTLRGTHQLRPSAQAGSVLATPSFTAGWATFGLCLAQGVLGPGRGVQVGSLATQTDVKTTWGDGSARFLLVTAKPTGSGALDLTNVAAPGGSFTPTIPTASVAFDVGGTVYTATMPTSVSGDPWLAGANLREWRSVVVPDHSGTPHPLLSVIFDCRVYNDGSARVDITAENVLNKSAGATVTYDLTVTVNGSTVLTSSAVPHYWLDRWRRTFTVSLTESVVTHDFAPWYAAKAIPKYHASVTSPTWNFSASDVDFSLMGRGGVPTADMGNVGGRPDLAPFPDWFAQYLVHQTANQLSYTLRSSEQGGAWPIHLRQTDGTIPTVDDFPNMWLDSRQSGIPSSDQVLGDFSSSGPNTISDVGLQHVPQLCLPAYLLTGDRYHMDEMVFWATGILLKNSPLYERHYATGLVINSRVRGIAWCLRLIAEAAVFAPDGHYLKSYLTSKAQANLDWIDAFTGGTADRTGIGWNYPTNSLPTSFEIYDDADFPPNKWLLVPEWQQAFLLWALVRCRDLGFSGGSTERGKLAAWCVKLFNSAPDFPPEGATAYYLVVGTFTGTWPAAQTPTYDADMAAVFTRNNTDPVKTDLGFDQYAAHWADYAQTAYMETLLTNYLGTAGGATAFATCKTMLGNYSVTPQDGYYFAEGVYS